MVQVTDTLKDPLGGNINASLRLEVKQSAGSLLQFTSAVYEVRDGAVDFVLEAGQYDLWIKQDDTFHLVGSLEVDGSSPNPSTLNDLLVVS